jgi:hypothetical protein
VDLGAGLTPEPQSHIVAAELDADLLEDGVSRRLDPEEALLAEELVGRNLPRDPGNEGMRSPGVALPAGSHPALARGRCRGSVDHVAPPFWF